MCFVCLFVFNSALKLIYVYIEFICSKWLGLFVSLFALFFFFCLPVCLPSFSLSSHRKSVEVTENRYIRVAFF